MFTSLRSTLLISIMLLLCTLIAHAGLPQTMNYQGNLKGADGTPVNGSRTMTFAIYSSTGGSGSLWQQQQAVPVNNGSFSVVLGGGDPPQPIALPFDKQYFLGVTVLPDQEMIPRQILTSSPYAFRAAVGDTVKDKAITTEKIADGAVTSDKLSANIVQLDNDQSVTGIKSFAPSSGTVPFTVGPSATGVVPNLNAEMVGGKKIGDMDSRYIDPTRPLPNTQQLATLRWDQLRGGSATITVGTNPNALVFDGSSIWVANLNGNSVMKINPVTGMVSQTISVVRPFALAFDGSSIWMSNSNGNSVMKINPTTGVVGPPIAVGTYPTALAFDGSSIWVANYMSGSVMKINPTTGEVSQTISVGAYPTALAFDGSSIWVTKYDSSSVVKINPTTGGVSTPITVGAYPSALVYDGSNIWVANYVSNSVMKINPVTGEVGPPIIVGANPTALAFDGSSIWVTNNGNSSVMKINPVTGVVSSPITVGPSPIALAFDGSNIWVASYNSNSIMKLAAAGQPVGPLSVGTAQLNDAVITETKIANGAVTPDKLSVNVVLLDNIQTITGIKNFAPSSCTVPFTVGAEAIGVVSNLNAEMVGGKKLVDLDNRYLDPTRPVPNAQQLATLRWDQVLGSNTISVGNRPTALAFDGTSLWVANYAGNSIMKINPATGVVSQTINVGINPIALALDGISIWVANYSSNSVMKINPATGAVSSQITVGSNPSALAFDGNSIWVANINSNNVMKINTVTGAVSPPITVMSPYALSFDGSSVWVANSNGSIVMKINPVTGVVAPPIAVGAYPSSLAFDGSSIWVANSGSNSVMKINPATSAVGPPIIVGSYPKDLAFDGSSIWVANNVSNSVIFHEHSPTWFSHPFTQARRAELVR